MAQPYIGEIRMFGGNFAPVGWEFCEGQPLPISENPALFQLIGTTFGGDGESTFNLPDLRGRLPVHQGNGFILAQAGGAEEVTLTTSQIPSHTHALLANLGGASAASPANAVMAEQLAVSAYQSFAPATAMAPQSIGPVGGSQPHTNMQPYLCVDFIISLFGIYPTPT